MSYEFKIAWRYFFSKSKQTVVNRINTFALIMVVITTTSLFVVLSAFSGLSEENLHLLLSSMRNNMSEPYDLRVLRG